MRFNLHMRCSPDSARQEVAEQLRNLANQIEGGGLDIPTKENESKLRLILDKAGNEIGQASFTRLTKIGLTINRGIDRAAYAILAWIGVGSFYLDDLLVFT